MIASRRSAPTGRLRLVRGAGRSARTSRHAGQAARALRSVLLGWVRPDHPRPSSCRRRRRLSPSSSALVGIGVGVHGGATGVGASAVRSSSAPKAATPRGRRRRRDAAASTRPPVAPAGRAAATAPTAAGLDPAVAAPVPRMPAAAGLRRRERQRWTRTWSARSKEGASTHSGQPSPSRGRYSSCRKRGTRCSLGSSCRRTASIRTRPSSVEQAGAVEDGQPADVGWTSRSRPTAAGTGPTRSTVPGGVSRPSPHAPSLRTR